VVPDALPAGVDVQVPAVVGRHGERRLRFEEGVLDALRAEDVVDGVGTGGEGGVDVATAVLADAQHVAVGAPHRNLGTVDGGAGVGDGPEHVVVDRHQLGGIPCLLPGLGHHDRQYVAGVGSPTALGDEHRPVLVDQPEAQLTRNIGGGEDVHHAGCLPGRG